MSEHFLSRLLWFMSQGLGLLQAGWFLAVTLLLTVNLVASVVVSDPFRAQRWKSWYYLMFVSLLFYPLIAVVAVLGENPGGASPHHQPPQEWAVWSLNALAALSIVVGVFFIIKCKGLRWFSLSVFLALQWLLQSMLLVASMAVTGVWM